MTRSVEPSGTPERLAESPARRETISAREHMRETTRSNPGPIRRTLRDLTAPFRKPSVLFFLGLAATAGWLAWYFRNAGDRVPISPFISDASRSSRIIAPLGTETPRVPPAPGWRPTP